MSRISLNPPLSTFLWSQKQVTCNPKLVRHLTSRLFLAGLLSAWTTCMPRKKKRTMLETLRALIVDTLGNNMMWTIPNGFIDVLANMPERALSYNDNQWYHTSKKHIIYIYREIRWFKLGWTYAGWTWGWQGRMPNMLQHVDFNDLNDNNKSWQLAVGTHVSQTPHNPFMGRYHVHELHCSLDWVCLLEE